MIIIYDLLKNEKDFFSVFNKHYKILEGGYEVESIRKELIKFKFYESDSKTHKLTRSRFIYNLIMFLPYIRLGFKEEIKLDETLILDFDNLNNDMLADFIDNNVTPYYADDKDPVEINKAYAEWRGRLKFTKKFTKVIGYNYSLLDEIQKYDRDKEYRGILQTRVDESKQPKEVEEYIDKISKKLVNNINNDPRHPFHPMLKCGEGVKTGQMNEHYINAGCKPDIYGRILPIYLNINYLYSGIDTVGRYFVDGNSGNKAAIMNDVYIGAGGYLSRKIVLSSLDTTLSKVEGSKCKCHNDNYPVIEIKSKKYLSRLIGRYYLDEDTNKLKCIDVKKDKHLIGKKIKLKSPTVCTDDEICHYCYGKLAKFNQNFHVGISSASRISMPIVQNVMSAKHLLQANSIELKFSEEFDLYFELNGNIIDVNRDLDVDKLEELILKIDKKDINYDGEEDDDWYKAFMYKITVVNTNTGEIIDITECSKSELYLTPALEYILKKKKLNKKKSVNIPFTDLVSEELSAEDSDDEYVPLFNIEILNNELTRPLHKLKALLDVDKDREYESIDTILQEAFDLIIEANIKSQFVSLEVILRSLIRDKEDYFERPDFRKPNVSYDILTVNSSLRKNPSPIVSLAFEDIKRQLINPATYRKNKSSMLDKFFQIIPNI